MQNQFKKIFSELSHRLSVRIIGGLLVFYFLFAYFAVNPLAQRVLPWVGEKQLASRLSVGKVSFDPLRLKTTIDDLQLTQTNGAPLAAFDQLMVDVEVSGLLQWAWKFKEISIHGPRVQLEIAQNGTFNWATLLAKLNEDKTPPSESLPRLILQHIVIHNGQVSYLDTHRATPFKTGLSPIDLTLDGFSTLPEDRGDYLLAARLPNQGGVLKWKGDMGVNPLASKGAFAVEGLNLARFKPLLASLTPDFKLEQGSLQLGFEYDFALVDEQPEVAVRGLLMQVSQLAASLQSERKLALSQFSLSAPTINFSAQQQPPLRLQQLGLNLEGLALQQGKDTHASLKHAALKLPQLDIRLNGATQAVFAGLSLDMQALALAKGNETLLQVPALAVRGLDFDLAERSIHVAQVALPDGEVHATLDKAGVMNWQQAFAVEAPAASETTVVAAAPVSDVITEDKPFQLAIADVQLKHWRLGFEHQQLLHPLRVSVADFNLGFAVAGPANALAITHVQASMHTLAAHSSAFKSPVVSLTKLNLNEAALHLAEHKVQVQGLQLSGLKTGVVQAAAGQPLNWQTILAPLPVTAQPDSQASLRARVSSPSHPQAAAGSQASPWSVSLKKLALDNASVHVEDGSLATPVVLDIEKALFEVRDASLDLRKPLPVNLAFQVRQGGQFRLHGKLIPQPLKLDANLQLQQLSLLPFSGYVNRFALLKLHSGALDVGGQLAVQQQKTLTGSFKGGFNIHQLGVVEEAGAVPFLSWERVGSDSLALTLAPNQLHMTTLEIVKPTGKLIIHEDKTMNVTRIMRQPATVNAAPITSAPNTATTVTTSGARAAVMPSAPESKAANSDGFPVNIETVRIDRAELDFADLSLTPQFGTHINTLSGVINGVSTQPISVAQVELDGKVDAYGSATIRGALQPFNVTQFTDLKLAFKNLEMNRLTPYSGKFAGRRIDSGRLSVALQYKIKQRQLAGENKFVIQKLKLGERVDSKEAANLPLDLAIAILEDSDGVIDLDLPIAGSLDDPQFSYGGIVWKAIKNVLTKIVTSPFKALGKLFGSGGDQLDGIVFEVGSAEITPPEQEKLVAVAHMLGQRTKLRLSVTPAYNQAADARALQEQSLRKQVAVALGIKLAAGQAPGPIDLSHPKTQKVLDDLYNTLTKKPLLKRLASKFEKPEDGHYVQLQEQLTVSIVITEADLQALATARGVAMQNFLADAGITGQRLRVLPPVKVSETPVTSTLAMEVNAEK
ncbi:DUF748 domain-containing protein [Methylophilus aquaticus]|uniref:DUF748 domain-containing protein n=1 Tax=Methylophilus aquaticus TaxID=1971610 RepID=A0ABT9JVB9_9PROT|nr:DUF748 domain-containing protein [Methylophilus aquaticus]MDP8568461.1 DUF748 domain-containing protein [Methylophilus aquaticus]